MTMPTPAVGPRGLALRCTAEGRAAALDGVAPTACPYGPERPFSRRAWLTGYVAGSRVAGDPVPSSIAEESDPNAPAPTPPD